MDENGFNKKTTEIATRTCVVTVTYENRFQFLKQVIEAVFNNGAGRVIIVDNASEPESKQAMQELKVKFDGKVTIIVLPENSGSAGGYKAGLEYAHNSPCCEYIWLLDDDNVPDQNALSELLKQYCELSRYTQRDRLALLSLRDFGHLKKATEGKSVKQCFKKKSSFMRFHIKELPNKFCDILNKAKIKRTVKAHITIPFGSFGGLFFHSTVLSSIGFPDERFFVYCDDCEYTSRLSRIGGKLVLVPSSHIRDIEPCWSFKAPFPGVLTAGSDFRVYYGVRNHAYFDSHIWQDSLFTYRLNKYIVYFILLLFAIRYNRWNRLKLIFRAVRDGETGVFGRNLKL